MNSHDLSLRGNVAIPSCSAHILTPMDNHKCSSASQQVHTALSMIPRVAMLVKSASWGKWYTCADQFVCILWFSNLEGQYSHCKRYRSQSLDRPRNETVRVACTMICMHSCPTSNHPITATLEWDRDDIRICLPT